MPRAEARTLFDNLVGLINETRFIDEDRARKLDDRVRGVMAELSNGFSMLEIALAFIDWTSHLAISPGKRLYLTEKLVRKMAALGIYNIQTLLRQKAQPPISTARTRFGSDNWKRWPFNICAQYWLIGKEFWSESTSDVSGVRPDHLELMKFMIEQILEAASPANYPLTNPDVISATFAEKGRNLFRGLNNLVEDQRRKRRKEPPPGAEKFRVGKDVACTPGKVIYQNRLIELIQYTPVTEDVDAEPVLFVPAWIMKYYILDLSPKNSMVRYLLEQGKTVFMISWKNPEPKDAGLNMNDYLKLGILDALEAVRKIVPDQKINAVGYCIGGTLLYIAAAHLVGVSDYLNSLTIFAAQSDFSEAGEIRALISESIFAQLESQMQRRGVLESDQMGGAFSALRSGDLIWGPAVDRYLLGKEPSMNDLMAWNADGTRMPYKMHSEYLRKMYLDNELAQARFQALGRTICLADIAVPMFVVGTVSDHVAPWKSVFKIHRLNSGEITFLLTTGGHNAGIVSGPSHPRRKHQIHTRMPGDHYMDPETWQQTVPMHDGSWWPVWAEWLAKRSSGKTKPPATGGEPDGRNILRDAPGEYVLVR